MQITQFERDYDNPRYSIGAASGEGQHFLFIVSNLTGTIEHLEQIIDGKRLIILDADVPLYMRTLVAVKAADEKWRHGDGSAVFKLRTEP